MQMDQHFQTQEFERLLRDFSRQFSRPDISEVERILRSALKHAAEFAGFDIAVLSGYSPQDSAWRSIGLGQASHSPIQAAGLVDPWILSQVALGKAIEINDLGALPPDATRNRDDWARHGIQSFYGAPLFGNSHLLGALVLGSHQPGIHITPESADRLQILGEIIVNGVLHSEREARLAAAIDAAGTGVWALDFSKRTFWATPIARALHGFDATETISLDKVLSAVHPDDRDLVLRTVEQASSFPDEIRIEYRVVRPDGTHIWILARGRPNSSISGWGRQLMGVCADITVRRQAEDALRNERALADALFDSVPGLLYLYSADGRLKRWNKQHEKLTGYSAEALMDMPAENWFGEDDLRTMQRDWARVFAEGKVTSELGLKMKDGSCVPYLLTGVPVEIDGKPHLVGIGMDISDRQRVEASLAQLRSELAHAARVNTLGELTSGLAHELNQPLAAILSNAQAARRFLAAQSPDLGEVRDALDDIVRDDKRAGEIVHGLRALSRKKPDNCERLDMSALVRTVADLIHGELISSDVPLSLALASGLPAVMAGQTEVQQILLNFMLNGIQAQKTIDSSARRLTVTTWHDKGTVIVAVRDQGSGISDEILPRLFEPFFSTKADGLGMGLAICRRIAQSYAGRVWAENHVEGGATFYVALPVAADGV